MIDFTKLAEGAKPFGPDHFATVVCCPKCGCGGILLPVSEGELYLHSGELSADDDIVLVTPEDDECLIDALDAEDPDLDDLPPAPTDREWTDEEGRVFLRRHLRDTKKLRRDVGFMLGAVIERRRHHPKEPLLFSRAKVKSYLRFILAADRLITLIQEILSGDREPCALPLLPNLLDDGDGDSAE